MHKSHILNSAVVVSALGYFVDIYDLLLFGIVRVPSLKDLGVPEDQLLSVGVHLINAQMLGLLLGGVLWGIWGDKKGRISVLFGSIFLYSVANIANAFVWNTEVYAILRFVAGIGLAGELGAAITLVSEVMTKETRGYGTAVVAGFGILGAVVAALIGDLFNWRVAYIVGGVMGLALLTVRVTMLESHLFDSLKSSNVVRGDLRMLLSPPSRFVTYLRCILIGVPIWYVIGILITFSPELAKALEVSEPIKAGSAIMWCYVGLAAGDLASGFISQWIKSRKRVILYFMMATLGLVLVYVFAARGWSSTAFYCLCVALGFSTGYWAVFVSTAAEHFGTNLRATVTTSVPNFVRGAVVPLTLGFQAFQPSLGLIYSALAVGLLSFVIALWAWWGLQETHGKDLNYFETL